jgi:F-type H+-transporting ATPase subunit a
MESIEHPPILHIAGVPDHVLYTWVFMLVLIGLAGAASRGITLVPRGLQNFFEVVLEQFLGMIDDVIGPEGRRYLPLIATIGLFVLSGNLIGLVPGFNGPTTNVNTNAACALIVFACYHGIGIRKHGLRGYLKHFMGPVPWLAPLMVPIELISNLARPLSLTVRLFGNMLGGHILLSVIFLLVGFDGLLGWAISGSLPGLLVGGLGSVVITAFTIGFLYPLKILVSFLQAFIFVMLTMLYIAMATEDTDHAEPHGAHH